MADEEKCKFCLHWLPNQSSEPKDENGETIRLCCNPKMGGIRDDDFSCEYFLGEDDPSLNLPDHLLNSSMTDPNPNPVDGPCEVLVVSYSKDIPWLEWALKCMEKHLSGFQGVTVAHPDNETFLFEPLLDRFKFLRLRAYPDVPGKGMLMHMVKMAEAELFLPDTTRYVLLCDSDCMFRMATKPEHYFWNDKPYQIVRAWEDLTKDDPTNPGSKVVSDCLQWREATDIQLGFKSDVYSMCMNTMVYPIDFFPKYRSHIQTVHNKPYREFMLAGRSQFPQSVMDHTAMGAYAYRHMNNRFHWFRVEQPPYPEDRKKAFWSHSGVLPENAKEIESFLK